jgi:formylglycine-generating enzyme required for sulfatase activity
VIIMNDIPSPQTGKTKHTRTAKYMGSLLGSLAIALLIVFSYLKGGCNEPNVRLRMVPEITITGIPGSTNVIEYVNLLKDTNNWITLTSIVLKAEQEIFYDTSAPASEKRFYRVYALGQTSTTNVFQELLTSMARIEAGTFLMGSPESDPERGDNEFPQMQITFTNAYWISKYEVTQSEYTAIMGNNPSYFNEGGSLPVENVSWHESVAFCEKLTQKERQSGRLPEEYVYRLPTEAEWEYAARAGSTNRFSYGDDIGYQKSSNYAWTSQNSGNKTHAVGQKTPNSYGIFDMYGNVFEWCADNFALYPGGNFINYQGPQSGVDKVYRGGSWGNSPMESRSAARGGIEPSTKLNSFGFRYVIGARK